MGILETWAKERTKRIQARNKRRTAAATARQEARADVAEATGMRAGQQLAGTIGDVGTAKAEAIGDIGTALAGGSVTRDTARGGRSGGGRYGGMGGAAKTDNTILYVGGAVLMGLLLMGQGQKK
jgi:hypothetical protein